MCCSGENRLCSVCGGSGYVTSPPPVPYGQPYHMVLSPVVCQSCWGSGWVYINQQCNGCRGCPNLQAPSSIQYNIEDYWCDCTTTLMKGNIW